MTEIYITDPTPIDDDIIIEKSLRPSQFDEFIGQKELVDNLKLFSEKEIIIRKKLYFRIGAFC